MVEVSGKDLDDAIEQRHRARPSCEADRVRGKGTRSKGLFGFGRKDCVSLPMSV
jgi:hypothetical protein